MGCCCAKPEDEIVPNTEPDEQEPLLNNSSVNDVGITVTSSDIVDSVQPTVAAGNNEQSALVSILHQTASELIDVSALIGVSVEHQEQQRKTKQYSSRMQQVMSSWSTLPTSPCQILSPGVSVPAAVLQAPLLPQLDLLQITVASERISTAIHGMRPVDKGQLVAPLLTLT